MNERVTVELPEDLARRARAVASHAHRGLEEFVVDCLDRAVADPPVEFLTDAEVLALSDTFLDAAPQDELSALLARNRDGLLREAERTRLDELMHLYRRGLVRKAQALREAVARGLRPRLDANGTDLPPG
jgi:hypothetical protein